MSPNTITCSCCINKCTLLCPLKKNISHLQQQTTTRREFDGPVWLVRKLLFKNSSAVVASHSALIASMNP